MMFTPTKEKDTEEILKPEAIIKEEPQPIIEEKKEDQPRLCTKDFNDKEETPEKVSTIKLDESMNPEKLSSLDLDELLKVRTKLLNSVELTNSLVEFKLKPKLAVNSYISNRMNSHPRKRILYLMKR